VLAGGLPVVRRPGGGEVSAAGAEAEGAGGGTPPAAPGRRPIRLLAVTVAVLGALALFLAGWQLAWRWGPYAAACFSIAAVAGLAAGLALVAVARLRADAGGPRRDEPEAGGR